MGLLRSEAMKYGMLVFPVQDARRYIDKIGKETNIQFEDMNAHEMRRPYRKHVQRIDEMERILRFVFDEMTKIDGCKIIKNRVNEFLDADSNGAYLLDNVEAELADLYKKWTLSKGMNDTLMNERNHAVEETQVAETALRMLEGGAERSSSGGMQDESFESSARRPLVGDVVERGLGYIAGVIPTADRIRFERALWKVSLGNALWQFEPIKQKVVDPKSGQEVDKSVFVVYFQGQKGALHQKVLKICTAFGVNKYEWPATAGQARSKCEMLKSTLVDKEKALDAYQNILRMEAADLLAPPTGRPDTNSKIEEWRLFCIKEKSIYSILNLCQGEMSLRVNVWFPLAEESKIQQVLESANVRSQQKAILVADKGGRMSVPPTYIRTNEYTENWQEVINTYGIPKYQEANPALLTVVTFPFIFGMMYGDIGHGSMLLLAGLWLCRNAEDLRFSQPVLFSARYMVLSMGIFAVYAGFLYNDFFSISLQLFTSGFKEEPPKSGHFIPQFDAQGDGCPLPGGNGPYPFGLDWAWAGASDELIYVNSLKMKLSVLFGVLQMFVGVLLRWSNAFYEKNKTDFFCECLPMMVFLLCFFGWMDVMILYKWVHPIDNPPNIINSLICMAMGLGLGSADTFPLWEGSVQTAVTLMQFTVMAVPIMLIPKPLLLFFQHRKQQKEKQQQGTQLLQDEEVGHSAHGDHGEEFEIGEVVIHQVIETIEFVLGTVSHTASYLRIWALSLAHQQLSLVFFQKTLTMGLEMSFPMNGIVLYFMFGAWFVITLGVLLGMDVLECFLHTLRLHWVEFQSKFYKANGEKFAPYNIKTLVEPQGDN